MPFNRFWPETNCFILYCGR